jgi:hypothetical protein
VKKSAAHPLYAIRHPTLDRKVMGYHSCARL